MTVIFLNFPRIDDFHTRIRKISHIVRCRGKPVGHCYRGNRTIGLRFGFDLRKRGLRFQVKNQNATFKQRRYLHVQGFFTSH